MVVCCSVTASLFMQAQEQKSRNFFIYEQAVKPDCFVDYLKAVQEEWNKASEYKISFYPVNTWSTGDFHYYFIIPIENMASIDALTLAWMKFHEELKAKMGDQAYVELMKNSADTVDYSQYYVYTFRPDISYIPQNPRLKPEERTYAKWDFYYVKAGKEKEFEAITREFITVLKSENFSGIYDVAYGSFGTQMPVYVVWTPARNAGDYYETQNKTVMSQAAMEKIQGLWQKLYKLVKRIESKDAYYNPELSYTPPPIQLPIPAKKKTKIKMGITAAEKKRSEE
jgi:hypothetical protein